MKTNIEILVIKYLNRYYGDMELIGDINASSYRFLKNGKEYMVLYNANKRLWIDYNTIWTDLINIFSLNDDQINLVIKQWMNKTYEISILPPLMKVEHIN